MVVLLCPRASQLRRLQSTAFLLSQATALLPALLPYVACFVGSPLASKINIQMRLLGCGAFVARASILTEYEPLPSQEDAVHGQNH